jgi:hypothetical protein
MELTGVHIRNGIHDNIQASHTCLTYKLRID